LQRQFIFEWTDEALNQLDVLKKNKSARNEKYLIIVIYSINFEMTE